ncbi:MAG: hypothetical protein HY002_13735 [Candidatus Rokubacteria bacterium]|nr:hypothetical protein [Candidatus Rokubacteria bacterium]
MTSDRERQAAAAIRVRIALDSIDEAQRLIEQAMQALSAVDAMKPERQKLACLSRRLIWTCFAVNAAANRLRHSPSPAPHGR